MIEVKNAYRFIIPLEEYMLKIGNKSIYPEEKLKNIYATSRNLYLIIMIYNGYLGSGNNINYRALKNAGYFEDYPYKVKLIREQFENILEMGGKNVRNIIID